MEIIRNGSMEAMKGPAETFTGDVRLDWMFNRPEPSRLTGARRLRSRPGTTCAPSASTERSFASPEPSRACPGAAP